MFTYIQCTKCGKAVSTAVPESTLVRAWVECPECVAKTPQSVISESIHPLTCGGNRHDEAHVAYQKEHGGDFGELIYTDKGLMCPVPGCGYKQNWAEDEEDNDEDLSRDEIERRYNRWLKGLSKQQFVNLIKTLIEMLETQEMVSIGTGVPFHAHTGEPLVD